VTSSPTGADKKMSPPYWGRFRGGMDKVKSVFVGLKPNLFTPSLYRGRVGEGAF